MSERTYHIEVYVGSVELTVTADSLDEAYDRAHSIILGTDLTVGKTWGHRVIEAPEQQSLRA